MRISTQLFTDGLFPVATIETDSDTRQTVVAGGVLDKQVWDDSPPLFNPIARHRAVLGRVVRAETGMRGAFNPIEEGMEQEDE